MNIKHFILILTFLPLLLFSAEVLNVKDLDNVLVRDFRTSGVAHLHRRGSSGDMEDVPLAWKIYGATANLQGKEYQIGGFRMDIESPEQGSFSVTASSAMFDVDEIEVHGDAPVEITGPGIHVVGLGFDLFTDAEEGVENARHLMFVIREAVAMDMSRTMLHRNSLGERKPWENDEETERIALTASRFTMQLSPTEHHPDGNGAFSGLRNENGVASLEGNVLLRIPPEQSGEEASSRQWDAWRLAGDRMVVFFSYSTPSREDASDHVTRVERVEVTGHLRVETNDGQQRLLGDRGVFTTEDERLTIDGNVLMMSQFQSDDGKESAGKGRWNFFFTERAMVFFALAEERHAQRQAHHRGDVVRKVELPGEVTMVAQDGSCHLKASRGEYSGAENRVSLQGGVRGELRNQTTPVQGDYLLNGPQVDFLLAEKPVEGRMVFPQGLSLQRRDGGSRIKAGWAGVEVVDPEERVMQISCTGNVLAELHGERGQDRELFLTGDKMVMQLRLARETSVGVLECMEWIDLPERVTVWGRAKGISHRIGGDHGRYDNDSHTISLEDNVVMALAQGTAEDASSKLDEVRVFGRQAVVHLAEGATTRQFGIGSIDLMNDVVARTADFSIYLSADQAHYDYQDERLDLSGTVRAEVTPGSGQRAVRQAILLETKQVIAQGSLQRVVFPQPVVVSSRDQALWLSGEEGILDVESRRCALTGDCHIVIAPQKNDSHDFSEVGLTTSRVLVYLEERAKEATTGQKSSLRIQQIDLPERLELFTPDGRRYLAGNHGVYQAQTNAVDLDGEVEVRFAAEGIESFEAMGLGGASDEKNETLETQELILNCDHLTAHLRSEPPAKKGPQKARRNQPSLSMLDVLEIPSRLQLRSADGSRKVTGDRCRYSQTENTVTLDGNCLVEYLDEHGEHLLETPRVVFDCNTRTIVTGMNPAAQDKEATSEPDSPPKRTTITIPFATRPAGNSGTSPVPGGQKKR